MVEELGLSAAVIGFIMTWDHIIHMLLQPYVGSLSDRTRARFGCPKPFLMIGPPLAALFFVLVSFARSLIVPLALAFLPTNLVMPVFRSPTLAHLGDLFGPEERSKANGAINLLGGLAGAVALFGGGALCEFGAPLPFNATSSMMPASIAVVVAVVWEDVSVRAEVFAEGRAGLATNLRELVSGTEENGLYLLAAILSWSVGWNAMEAFFTLCARNVLGIDIGLGAQTLTAFAAPLILLAIPRGPIAARFGRRPTILMGLAGMLAGVLVGFVIRQPTVLLIVLAVMGTSGR